MSITQHTIHYVSNQDGWQLELKQCRFPNKVDKKKNPLVIVPGYGMNSFIFGYHPRGLSMEDYLTSRGFEVWSINLRGQGDSKNETGSEKSGLYELSCIDLKSAIHYILKNSKSTTEKVDLIGCSLGGTIAYSYAAFAQTNTLGSLVAIGSPMRWEAVHPLLKTAFFSPKLVGMIRLSNTKSLARLVFPLVLKTSLMRLYLHEEITDVRRKDILLETMENPNRFLNQEIAQWIKDKDLHIRGRNLTQALKKVKNPLLCVLANEDGIVPPLTALSAHEVIGSSIKETLVVGTEKLRFAHADLFISNHSHDLVFKPIADWLLKRNY